MMPRWFRYLCAGIGSERVARYAAGRTGESRRSGRCSRWVLQIRDEITVLAHP